MRNLPIENYGIVGDMRTAALVGMNGSIDWLCYPRFDSPSVFAALLDPERGGHFCIAPQSDAVREKQFYWPDTNVLVTRFLSPDGVGQLIDFMPICTVEGDRPVLVRQLHVVRGRMRFDVDCQPRFDYARAQPRTAIAAGGAVFHGGDFGLGLATSVALELRGPGAGARVELGEGETAVFVLRGVERGATDCGSGLGVDQADELFLETVGYWRRWLDGCTYTGRWREQVRRSALVLKLLTYQPSGAIVAAPTTSLPEALGGVRNWDYRYTWIRDAAFTLYGLLRVGFAEEAAAFMSFIEARCHELEPDGSLQIMYGIDGRHELTEKTLDHLDGYAGSRPVRIGNGAHGQLQLDIYGALMDAVYLYNKYGLPSPMICGVSCGAWWTGCARTGNARTRASGRCAGGARRSSIRSSCAGSPWTVGCAWPTSAPSPPTARAGRASATRSTRTSWSGAGTSSNRHSSKPTAPTPWMPPI